ncbi:MAG: quercetin dioxygenase-like cupin family protein [Yoonia sp.]|jgi:quercetin dioxygenase-like cupin family protein
MVRPAAVAVQLVDDPLVRVTRFEFAVGAETGWHTHAMDYVITAVTDCQMQLENPDGQTRDVFVPAGAAYRRDAGIQHYVINGGDAPMVFVEVEIK